MSTSSRERTLLSIAVALIVTAAPASHAEDPGEVAAETSTETAILDEGVESAFTAPAIASLDERRRALEAHEARLAIWEKDLTRRSTDDAYFTDLEGYVTPTALARSFVLGALVSVGLTLLVLRTLERRGLWRRSAPARSSRELAELETRVLTGLREFDALLSRVYERLQTDAVGSTPAARPTPPVSSTSFDVSLDAATHARGQTPSGRPARAGSVREQVTALARGGVAPEEIGRRLGLGHAEIDFILRTEASR
jgi:hypothetical protein